MTSARLDVRLLGRIDVRVDGRQVRIAGRQAQALFALLVLDSRPRGRDAIATDLWPESDATSSASLRQALWLVRSGLAAAGIDPERVLEVEPDTVALRPDAVKIDTARFTSLLGGEPAELEAALHLYRGDLAEGFGHECFASERERLSDAYEDALALVAESRLDAGNLAGAREAAERLLARDVLREEAHAVLIAVHGTAGTRSQVVRQYRRLREILRHELDVDPLPETEVIYRAALARSLEASRRRATAGAFAPRPFVPTLVAQG